jgi:hypothetical protein
MMTPNMMRFSRLVRTPVRCSLATFLTK